MFNIFDKVIIIMHDWDSFAVNVFSKGTSGQLNALLDTDNLSLLPAVLLLELILCTV